MSVLEFFAEYGLFLAKVVTFLVAFVVVVGVIAAAGSKGQKSKEGKVEVASLNEHFDELKESMLSVTLSDSEYKAYKKEQQKEAKEHKKAEKKGTDEHKKKRLFVIEFEGDIQASAVENLRHEVSAILMVANKNDEVLVNIESAGGMVHTYGLAASQLQRIKDAEISLTVCVDKIAASGGYLMACIADSLYAAPFAILGSIGVLAQIPNFNRVLKKYDVDYDILTAGEHKQSMTMFGENTEKMKQKLRDDLEDTHELFKSFVSERRPQIDIAKVATGEIWYGQRAIDERLVDGLLTSDSYLQDQVASADVYRVAYQEHQSLQQKLGEMMHHVADKTLVTVFSRNQENQLSRY